MPGPSSAQTHDHQPIPDHDRVDVVVIGGGLIGSAIAWRLSQRGRRVTVVHDQRTGTASHVAAGMLAPVTEAAFTETDLLALNLASLARFDGFATHLERSTQMPSGLSRTPTLSIGYDADDAARLADLGAFLRGRGLTADPLTARECRAVEPLLAAQVRSGLLVPADWSCDNRLLWTALVAALVAAPGVDRVNGTVTDLVRTGGRVSGVRVAPVARVEGAGDGDGDGEGEGGHGDGGTRTGEIGADQVVLAGGAWSAGLDLGFDLPVRPIKGQIIRLDPGRLPRPQVTVRAITRGTESYLVTHASGAVVLGATVEEQGFDPRPTGQGTYELLRDARSVLPIVGEYAVAELGVGFRPGTPDNAPVLGPSPVDGLVLATGHYRNGVLLTPVTADAIADLLVDGALPEVAAGFTLDRFGIALDRFGIQGG